jgi:S1-C subfamily serine protease
MGFAIAGLLALGSHAGAGAGPPSAAPAAYGSHASRLSVADTSGVAGPIAQLAVQIPIAEHVGETPYREQIEPTEARALARGLANSFSGASIGTAWPISKGYVVTNNHVIAGSADVVLMSSSGEKTRAWPVLRDELTDIALLEVEDPAALPPALPLAGSRAGLGASVFTLGFPRIDVLGATPKLSNGVISGTTGLRDDPTGYQTTVAIQPGNSGGPLFNMRGEVVGVVKSMLGLRDVSSGNVYAIQNASCALKIESLKELSQFVPQKGSALNTLLSRSGDLETLAGRLQNSVLIVVAR